jgi:hypothetical protein
MKKRLCLNCGKGILIKVDNIITEMDGYVFIAGGERCTNCKEEFLFEQEANKIIESAKRLGVWPEPLKLYRTLSKSGKGLVFRIPSDLEKQLQLKEGKEIAISKLGNKILIEP